MQSKFSSRELLESLNIDNHMGYCYYEDDLAFLDSNKKRILIEVLSSKENDCKMDRNIYLYENVEERKLTEDINVVKEKFLEVLKYANSIDVANFYWDFVEFLMYGYNLDMTHYLFKNFKLEEDIAHKIIFSILYFGDIYNKFNAFELKDFPNSNLVEELLDDIYKRASKEKISEFLKESLNKIIADQPYKPLQAEIAKEAIDNSNLRKYLKEILNSFLDCICDKKECIEVVDSLLNVDMSLVDDEYYIKVIEMLIINAEEINLLSGGYVKMFFPLSDALLNPHTYSEEGIEKLKCYLDCKMNYNTMKDLFLSPIYENSSVKHFSYYIRNDRNSRGVYHSLDGVDKTDKTTLYSRAQNTEKYRLLRAIDDMDDFIINFCWGGTVAEYLVKTQNIHENTTDINQDKNKRTLKKRKK